ncbi:AcrR family transcriptional regulator [Actinoplanes tereljensis]|uniref:HTH tetR-type domain-containing protein n=1 Tax=Paractinoplanes tereljensis TaxID=571912 RepID=A0A919NT39_9ACTN|nr:TetR family transcriptional regulator [Actinoplanes tereljensis]GIF23297.1 hypothetical protein Ate02nite_60270 [Actinoplanes tereljensis]
MARSKAFDDATVVAAARDAFWEYGFAATSLAQLQAATGLSKSSLYETYGSKRALFDRAVHSYLDVMMSPLLEPMERDGAGGADIEAFFRAFGEYFRSSAPRVATRGCLILNTATELPHLDEAAAEMIRDFRARVRGAFLNAARGALPAAEAQRHADLLTAWHVGLITTSRMDRDRAVELAGTIADEVRHRM